MTAKKCTKERDARPSCYRRRRVFTLYRIAFAPPRQERRLGTCQKLAGGEGGGVGILNLGSEMR